MKTAKIKKYYFFGEAMPPIHYRAGTSDETIINSILVNKQEYMFPLHEFHPKRIYDMGANIGILSVLFTHLYPEAKIIAFEPQKDNYELLKKNTEHYPNIIIRNYGLGARSGKAQLWPSADPANHGGFSNFIQSESQPEEIAIESIRSVVESLGVPDLIKIDVEGAECEILRNFPHIDQVKWIAGELHSEDAEFLMLHTLSTHFRLSLQRNFFDKCWHFHALNKSWTDFGIVKPKANEENGLEEKATPMPS